MMFNYDLNKHAQELIFSRNSQIFQPNPAVQAPF